MPDECLQLGLRHDRALFDFDPGDESFAEFVVGDAETRGIADPEMGQEDGVDLGGVDVDTAGYHNVGRPV